MGVGEGGWLVLFITAQRLIELLLAERNFTRLVAMGGIEYGRSHYPMIVLLHVGFIASLWVLARDQQIHRGLLGLFLLLQVARLWVIVTLGRYWTTRVIVVPGQPLVRCGPYRYVAHPNYAIVTAEFAIVPLAVGLPLLALTFSILNGAVLAWRIRIESAALKVAGSLAKSADQ